MRHGHTLRVILDETGDGAGSLLCSESVHFRELGEHSLRDAIERAVKRREAVAVVRLFRGVPELNPRYPFRISVPHLHKDCRMTAVSAQHFAACRLDHLPVVR